MVNGEKYKNEKFVVLSNEELESMLYESVNKKRIIITEDQFKRLIKII